MDKGSLLGLHLYTYGLPRSNKSKPWKTGALPSLALPCLPLPLDWTGLGGTGLDKNKNKYKNKEIKKIILKLLVLNKINLYFNYKKNIYIILKNINNVI